VDTDGSITDIEIMKNLADGCGEEAKRVVASMNNMKEKWIPGRQKSKPVKVEIVLPFQFKL
jgi:protein TonB